MLPVDHALSDVKASLTQVDAHKFTAFCTHLSTARHIGVYGCGREALQLRGLVMRLFHLGLDATMVGDLTMPPLGNGDCLVACAGPGELASVSAHMRTARAAGATVLFLTAEPSTPSTGLADLVLTVPAQTMARDQDKSANAVLPMGSVFEGALFFLFELMIHHLRETMQADPDEMRARHTNME